MGLFTAVTDAHIIVRTKGVYRQVAIYERDGLLYAAIRGGYVRLRGDGATTVPDVHWLELTTPAGAKEPGKVLGWVKA